MRIPLSSNGRRRECTDVLRPREPAERRNTPCVDRRHSAHPGAYFSHRWALTQALFGRESREWPTRPDLLRWHLSIPRQSAGNAQRQQRTRMVPAHVRCDADQPSAQCRRLMFILVWSRTFWSRHSAATRGGRETRICRAEQRLLLYAAPLPLIAPAAELRYTGWTCLAAMIGAALVFAAPRKPAIPACAGMSGIFNGSPLARG